MATRKELETEWIEYQRWQQNQGLEWADYLEHRDRVNAQDNIQTLRDLIDSLDEQDEIPVWKLKELLKYV